MYNYQYSFGYVLSHIIYNRLVNDKNYVDKYLKFISMGSNQVINALIYKCNSKSMKTIWLSSLNIVLN